MYKIQIKSTQYKYKKYIKYKYKYTGQLAKLLAAANTQKKYKKYKIQIKSIKYKYKKYKYKYSGQI